ncbi:hypothetical protein P3X46_014655 [Hevea brasiliensis]|uniref:DUF1442 domain-containing protein n=1 Tax=Hevea brasiliensis TaxID=3981 RepID=A0ABQ9LWL6_HEVBR|nr:uncharacterized protein LOC110656232 [Hevea brasiliensis]KAJ9171265.1 hypothetical protein P3X46_014655 [Hevea brasiliensis]
MQRNMKLVWSPDTALNAYIYTVKSCENLKESGVPELLSALAAGWNATLIVESWSHGSPTATSIGLAVAANHTCGRHVCLVPDERSRSEYAKSMQGAGMTKTEVIVGDVEEVMAGLSGVDFLVVDCKRRDFFRFLRFAKLSHKGAVLVRKNAYQSNLSGFRWHWVLERGTRVVRSVSLPVGKGLDIANIGSSGGGANSKRSPNRWIRFVDEKSGEEHVFRG